MNRREFLKVGIAAVGIAVLPKIVANAARTDGIRFGRLDTVIIPYTAFRFIETPNTNHQPHFVGQVWEVKTGSGFMYSSELADVLRKEMNHYTPPGKEFLV